MSIFRRRKHDETADPAATDTTGPEEPVDVSPADQREHPRGPLDAADVDGPGDRLDLGGLWIPVSDGMEVRVEMDQSSGEVSGVQLVIGESALQLQAFAAPRSSGIWAEVRREIGESIRSRGGTAEVLDGRFGTELRTRMPQAGPNGRTVYAPARFVGVDGPRWFVRGVFSGRAAIDDGAAEMLEDVLRRTVVVRGTDPMAPRELLPMHLPGQESEPAQEGGADLNPLERGPEITEVR